MTPSMENLRSGETEAIVIVKAAPQVGQRHGETICCAGIDLHGNWNIPRNTFRHRQPAFNIADRWNIPD